MTELGTQYSSSTHTSANYRESLLPRIESPTVLSESSDIFLINVYRWDRWCDWKNLLNLYTGNHKISSKVLHLFFIRLPFCCGEALLSSTGGSKFSFRIF
ncbi:unnamed protein product [Caretta caretta]